MDSSRRCECGEPVTHVATFTQYEGGRSVDQRDMWLLTTNTLDLCAACAAEMRECDPTAVVEPLA